MTPPVQAQTAQQETDSRRTGEQHFHELSFPQKSSLHTNRDQSPALSVHPAGTTEDIVAARKSSNQKQIATLASASITALVSVASGALSSIVVGDSFFSEAPLGGKGFNGMAFLATLGMSTFLMGVSGFQAFTELRDWLRVRNRDAKQPNAELLDAIAVCSEPEAYRSEVQKAANLCLRYLQEPGGAIVTAHALSGIYQGLHHIGPSQEMAALCQELGFSCASRYSGLPVQQELLKVILSSAPQLFPLCNGEREAERLAESLSAVVMLASPGKADSFFEELAVELYTLARGIPNLPLAARHELLSTAYEIVPKDTPIAENVELQLREVRELVARTR
jgi:hypothetical protein